MKIPKSKKDILVKNYLKYLEYIKTEPNEEKEILKQTVKIFYELDEDAFNAFEYQNILDMFQIISNILQTKQDLVPIFKHDDIEYGINPNFSDMTFSEMIDCDTEDVIQQICVLYRPIVKRKGDKYTIEKYDANIEILEELRETLTLDIYLGFVGFFLKISQSCLNSILHSLTVKAIDPERKRILENYMDGILGYTNYAAEI